jgi:hypothetical protein
VSTGISDELDRLKVRKDIRLVRAVVDVPAEHRAAIKRLDRRKKALLAKQSRKSGK